jgi:hypothetical protein
VRDALDVINRKRKLFPIISVGVSNTNFRDIQESIPQHRKKIFRGNWVCLRNNTAIIYCGYLRNVEAGLGPVNASPMLILFRHMKMVLGLILERLAKPCMPS